MVQLLIQMSPIGVVIVSILLLHSPPVQAALTGVVMVSLLWILGAAGPFSVATTSAVIRDTWVLFLSTAGVIIPGLAFVIIVERGGAPQAIGDWVRELGWAPPAQVIFILLGLAPLLESMTGFGVSLIATVPLLMGLFGRKAGMKMALCGMVVMPWGTLGLATMTGALLAHMPAGTLGSHSAFISAPVFFSLATIALWKSGIRTVMSWLALVIVTTIFIVILFTVNRWIGPEVSGVCAGLAVTIVGLGLSVGHRKTLIRLPPAAWPYLALLGIIVLSRSVFFLTGWDSVWVISGEHVSWKPLASPGLALLLVTVLTSFKQGGAAGFPWHALFERAKFSVATILLFLLLSQIMVNAGFLAEAQRALQSMSGFSLAPTIALLAGLAGYVTGSNVGGDTLIMPSVAALTTDHGPWLAAMVNSAAGHGALGSLSVMSLVTGLAAAERREEHSLIRFAFSLVALNIFLIALAGLILFYLL